MNEKTATKRFDELKELFHFSSNESDRGRVLIIASHIEFLLRRVLEAFLVASTKEVRELFEGPYAPFGSLSGKTKAAFVMGLITKDERDRIDAVRNVRNAFAHEVTASFDHPKILKICRKLVVDSGRMELRNEFMHAALNSMVPILYRDLQIMEVRRKELTKEDIEQWSQYSNEDVGIKFLSEFKDAKSREV